MDTTATLPGDDTPIERIDGIVVFRPAGDFHRLQAAVDRISLIAVAALAAGLDRCVVDITKMAGFPVPSLSERHAMVREWATAVDGKMVVAMVCPPDFLDPERFGVVTAANFGLRSNAFDNTRDAIAWLRDA